MDDSNETKKQVSAVIRSFECGEIAGNDALSKLHDLTGRTVELGWLQNYWRAESLEDFVSRLCSKPVENWQAMTDHEAEELITEYLNITDQGRRDSIESAINRRFTKPSGTLNGLVFQRDLTNPRLILDELKKDTTIRL